MILPPITFGVQSIAVAMDPKTGQWVTVKVTPETPTPAEPEWKVGDRFESDTGTGRITELTNFQGVPIGVSFELDSGLRLHKSYQTFLNCARRPTTTPPHVPTDRVCSNPTCARTCDSNLPCWWCGGAP